MKGLIAKEYSLKTLIGKGTFGSVYEAESIKQKDKTVAIKIEKVNAEEPTLFW